MEMTGNQKWSRPLFTTKSPTSFSLGKSKIPNSLSIPNTISRSPDLETPNRPVHRARAFMENRRLLSYRPWKRSCRAYKSEPQGPGPSHFRSFFDRTRIVSPARSPLYRPTPPSRYRLFRPQGSPFPDAFSISVALRRFTGSYAERFRLDRWPNARDTCETVN